MLRGLICFSLLTNMQEEEIKDKAAKIEYAEQRLMTLNLELKVSFGLLKHPETICLHAYCF